MPSLVSQSGDSSGESSGPLVDNTCSVVRAFSTAQVVRELGRHTPVLVGERYELLREIGSGGYGTVYEAHDHDFGRRVAVKVLALGDRDVEMREGQLLAELHHPNVVAIHDHGIGPDFRYFVMQLLPGPTLRTWWDGKTPAQTVGMFVEAGSGLAAAHVKGLVHRDFKPSNVRIGPEGQAVVVDFGLARHIDTLERDAEQIGRFQGTVDYAPPERLRGQPGDERADQFSFCVALWEALSGVNPFGPCTPATTPQQRLRALAAGVAGTPRGSRRVARAVRRGLSLQPQDRFLSMHALMAAIGPSRWTWQERLVIGAAVVIAAIPAIPLIQLIPSRGGASSEFVASVHASCLGPVAIAAARQGNANGALLALDSADSAKRSKETSRGLALASETVAIELEKRITPTSTSSTTSAPIMDTDLLAAWELAIFFARDAGDADLQRGVWEQHDALLDHLKAGRALPR